jgi:hypothetical protein
MARMKSLRRALEDIRDGRHREAYALFLIGVVLVILGLVGVVSGTVMLGAILLALTFLVFHTTQEGDREPALDHVLAGREKFGAFSQLLPGVRDLRIYGPTAASLLVYAGDIREIVLRHGGKVRVMILADNEPTRTLAAIQLDDVMDLDHNLRNSLATLRKLGSESGFSCRQLPVNPGFGLVIVNAEDRDGYVIFESHGFKDDNITNRMHVVIRRADSPRWFRYWISRFEAMWEAGQPLPDIPAGTANGIAAQPPSAGKAPAGST